MMAEPNGSERHAFWGRINGFLRPPMLPPLNLLKCKCLLDSMILLGSWAWIKGGLMYGTKVPRFIWALNSGPAVWPMAPISFYPKLQSEPTPTAGPSFATWSLPGKSFPNTKERIMSKRTIHNVLGSAQETLLPGMLAGVGTKFQDHFHHIPLPPNHPLTIDDIGHLIALTMAVIMIPPLI